MSSCFNFKGQRMSVTARDTCLSVVAGVSACVTERREYPGVVCQELCGERGDVVVRRATDATDTQRRRRETDSSARQ